MAAAEAPEDETLNEGLVGRSARSRAIPAEAPNDEERRAKCSESDSTDDKMSNDEEVENLQGEKDDGSSKRRGPTDTQSADNYSRCSGSSGAYTESSEEEENVYRPCWMDHGSVESGSEREEPIRSYNEQACNVLALRALGYKTAWWMQKEEENENEESSNQSEQESDAASSVEHLVESSERSCSSEAEVQKDRQK